MQNADILKIILFLFALFWSEKIIE